MNRNLVSVAATSAVLALAIPVAASVDDYPGQTEDERLAAHAWNAIDDVRVATARYHDLSVAIDHGFIPFALDGGDEPTCFDSQDGGMGMHYVQGVDSSIAATSPESLVYELTPEGRHRLVAVEYIVPQDEVENELGEITDLPEVLGRPFHKHPSLPLYILHAWVWEDNPDGMFADFNPNVAACP